MKNIRLRYDAYKILKSNIEDLTLEKIIYKTIRELTLQHKIEWITLDNILIIVTSLMDEKISEKWANELASATKTIETHGFLELREITLGHFSRAICVRLIK